MAIDYDRLMARPFPERRHSYTRQDSILYALGLGLGADPVDPAQLQFVYEDGLKAFPTMAVVLGYPGFWMREADTGIDWVRVVHGEQRLTLHAPVPPEGTVIGRTRISHLIDKGPGHGALVIQERTVTDAATGTLIATIDHTTFCRADGGFGGPKVEAPVPHRLPETAPDCHCDIATLPQAALIYRLAGDDNPLHADPAVARAAGYPQPILHGLATYGVAAQAVLKTFCGMDPARLRAFDLRFSAPVFPGETVRTEMWRAGDTVSFRARVLERDSVVLNNGRAIIA
ncbi:acyl dehydratase [Stella humosa]|uniref:Acyl dehydratase n=1 Tax=Stella humosa TaxID=94 RepID=A0A3N1LH18_9PROT|nr:MaoC/PaaZ C-terminal domain-containing protein [Stella humosa]ROP90807.1 acyl dehydratase [Stella humosa]BBK34847.1 3-alpha,7-alpha,12-alpha-trihydroxy-5-beta-choles t-24-enoyl-CoA hydratase [Stella humosa]